MSIPRQSALFFLVGVAQLLLDWLLFVALSSAGLSVLVSNIAARAGAAACGFWMNGRFTFAQNSFARLGSLPLMRYFLVWSALTALSTLLVGALAGTSGLKWAWLAKPLIEAFLALISFFLQRNWVFK